MDMASKKEGYVNVSLPVDLADEVRKLVEKKRLGYTSLSEFVKEAVRAHLIQVKKISVEE